MRSSFVDDGVWAYWCDRPLEAADAFALMEQFLRALQARGSVFSNYYIGDNMALRYTALMPDFSNFRSEMVAGVAPERGFFNGDPKDAVFSMSSRSVFGFSSLVATVPRNTEVGCRVKVKCGCLDASRRSPGINLVNIVVSKELATPDFLRDLLEQTVSFWRPADAVVTRPDVGVLLRQPAAEADVGWLTYLADARAASVVPSAMETWSLADGVVIEAAGRPGTEDDDEYVGGLVRLRDALRAEGFLGKRSALSRIP